MYLIVCQRNGYLGCRLTYYYANGIPITGYLHRYTSAFGRMSEREREREIERESEREKERERERVINVRRNRRKCVFTGIPLTIITVVLMPECWVLGQQEIRFKRDLIGCFRVCFFISLKILF